METRLEDSYADPDPYCTPRVARFVPPAGSILIRYCHKLLLSMERHLELLEAFKSCKGKLEPTRKSILRENFFGDPKPRYTALCIQKMIMSYYGIWIKEYFLEHGHRPPIANDRIHLLSILEEPEIYETVHKYFTQEIEYQKTHPERVRKLLTGELTK